ncbi:MAG: CopG family transcriptional regulator, partial [Betaproteobacteria bacterium]|nr:CopG family transcriptional regulator [Betaproteobacteria bacterium]
DKLERDQNILIETLALYVRYFLTVSTPVPEAHQEAARAQGRARFEQFIEQLGRHLLRGRSLVKDVVEEIQPDQSQFFGLQENANTSSSTDDPGAPS